MEIEEITWIVSLPYRNEKHGIYWEPSSNGKFTISSPAAQASTSDGS